MRGEYCLLSVNVLGCWELPPRARRILDYSDWEAATVGTTSACAENTESRIAVGLPRWNYLRVRGEYEARGHKHENPRELPPRARRILIALGLAIAAVGTTSACAENTLVR